MIAPTEALAGAMQKHRPRETQRIVWHYTSGRNLEKILRAGELLPAGKHRGEKPAVWFTARQDWDPATALAVDADPDLQRISVEGARIRQQHGEAAQYAYLYSMAERIAPEVVGYLARIGVAPETAPYTWDDIKRMRGVRPSVIRQVESDDRARGSNPADWRISFEPVPASKWIAVEVRSGRKGTDNEWRPLRAGNAYAGNQ